MISGRVATAVGGLALIKAFNYIAETMQTTPGPINDLLS